MSAGRAAVTAFNEKDQYPVEEWGWDTWQARINRYAVYQSRYQNTTYKSIESFAATLKANKHLYKHIRSIYNPVARENRLIRSSVYPGAIDLQNLEAGALPIDTKNEALRDPLKQIMKWSNLGRSLALYVKWAALLGDCGLWLADERDKQRVRLEVLHPGKIRECEYDSAGNVKAAVIEYQKAEDPDVAALKPARGGILIPAKAQQEYTFTLKVDQNQFKTFKNGEPFAFYHDASGNPVMEWDNDYGFVPLVVAHFQDSGLLWGENSFFNAADKIDEINDAASLLNDSIRNVVIPILQGIGIRKPTAVAGESTDVQFSVEDRDTMRIIYLPNEKTRFEAISIPISIADAAMNIDKMLLELERDMPVLALQRIREQSAQMTAPGIRSGYSDAVRCITSAQQNLDPALVAALQMGVTMAAVSGYTGFQAFSVNSFASGAMDFDIKARAVIDDTIDKQAKITTLLGIDQKSAPLQALLLKELEYSDTEIRTFLADDEAAKQATRQNDINTNDALAVQKLLDKMGLPGGAVPSPDESATPTPQLELDASVS